MIKRIVNVIKKWLSEKEEEFKDERFINSKEKKMPVDKAVKLFTEGYKRGKKIRKQEYKNTLRLHDKGPEKEVKEWLKKFSQDLKDDKRKK